MPMRHEEIQSLLPEYLSSGLPLAAADEVKAHIASCGHCQDALSVLVELQRFEVADPGDLFWKTLPNRVAREAGPPAGHEDRSIPWFTWVWRFVPFAGAALLIALLMVARLNSPSTVVSNGTGTAGTYDGLADYDGLSESDIPDIGLDGEDAAALARMTADPDGYAYHGELVALKAGEMERLSRAVQRNNPRGG